MGDKSGIEWTDATWNPVRGCSRVSAGCMNCYAERVAGRFSGPGQPYEGLVTVSSRHSENGAAATGTRAKWNGKVRLVPSHLSKPLSWRDPRRVFVNSMSDLFHEELSNEEIAAVFGVMAAAPRHTFQILTKRPARMLQWFESWRRNDTDRGLSPRQRALCSAGSALESAGESVWSAHAFECTRSTGQWPLPNVWLGVSAENQETADERTPLLLQTPAAVRFVSYEPALGPINFRHLDSDRAGGEFCQVDALTGRQTDMGRPCRDVGTGLDWIIAGSESGPGARPAQLEWYRSVRDQCQEAGVSFFLKQHAERGRKVSLPMLDGAQHMAFPAA